MSYQTQYDIALDGKPGSPNKKFDCPVCRHKRCFRRLFNYATGQYLPDENGICDRINKCGYKNLNIKSEHRTDYQAKHIELFKRKPLVHIPQNHLFDTLNDYENNSFVIPLANKFSIDKIEKAISDYYLGSIQWLTGQLKSVVFWFIDKDGNVRAGQVKQFQSDCKTQTIILGENEFKAYWIHKILKKQFQSKGEVPQWLNEYESSDKITCLFGEHLLNQYPNKTVGLVEAPKSAIIASMVYPELVWLATSSLSYLTKDRCKVLKGRKVILFPDCGIPNKKTGKTCLDDWKERIQDFRQIADFTFSTLLEDNATDEQKESGFDLADLILQEVSKPKYQIKSEDIKKILSGKLRTGNDFGNLVFATMELKNGSLIELLLDKDENIITSHEKIKPIEKFFDKSFFEGLIDDTECLMNIPKN